MNFLSSEPLPLHLLITGGTLAIAVTGFLAFFLFPAILHRRRLSALLGVLRSQPTEASPEKLQDMFRQDVGLSHLWKEYRKSLHEERAVSDGVMRVVRWRSTLPAEVFWNGQFVVDSRLRTEFFKHLPGILTGIGIIGTFAGLIDGLQRFKIGSDNAQLVKSSLDALMASVGHAFLVSAAAIAAAMVITLIEKLLLTSLYRITEDIAQDVDSRFASGAGEDYLEQVARATETSASQLKILKDSLIQDLKEVLATDLKAVLSELSASHVNTIQGSNLELQQKVLDAAKRQIEAARDDSEALGGVISGAIATGLAKPLEEIKEAVKSASGDQSAAAIRMLQDVMASFSQKLNELFGGQISGINELNQRTAQTMESAVLKLEQLVVSLTDSGARTSQSMADQMAKAIIDMEARQGSITDSTQALVQELRSAIEQAQKATSEGVEASGKEMAERMAGAIEAMERRQDAINERTREFVEQIKRLVDSSQTETSAKMQSTLEELGKQVGAMMEQLRESQRSSLEQGRAREEETAGRTQQAVGAMTDSVESVVKHIGEASARMQESVSALAAVTTSAISGMSDGAQQVNTATRNFANAGDRVSGVMGQAATVSTGLTGLTTALTAASTSFQQGLQDYKMQRDSVSGLVAELRSVVANAKTEASVTSDVLSRIESATQKLSQAQTQTERFMEGVATVLATAHEQFRSSVTKSLDKSNTEFHAKLSSAVGLLSASIKELDDVLSTATPKGRKP